jgi:hypothetical protein
VQEHAAHDHDHDAVTAAVPAPRGRDASGGRAAAALGVAAFALAWANAADGPFQWDDWLVIVDNPRVHALSAWWGAVGGGIRPVLSLTYTLQWIAGAGARGYHLANVATHALAVPLAFVVCRRVAGPTAAAIAALVFAVHPVQTDAVTYVSGRSASLGGLWYLAGLAAWPAGVDGAPGRRALALTAAALAAGTRETTLTFPAAVVLLEAAVRPGDGWRAALRRSAPAWIAALVSVALVAASARYRTLLAFSVGLRDPLANLPVGVQAVGYLASRLVCVGRLSVDPQLPPATRWTSALALGATTLVALAAAGVAGLRRAPALAVAALWFLLHLAPTATIFARADVASERHLYLALLGPALVVGVGLAAAVRRRPRTGWTAVATLALALALATRARNRDWSSELALWASAIRLNPTNARALNNLGWAWHRAGCVDDARAAYEAALRVEPGNPNARGNLAGLATVVPKPCATPWTSLRLPPPESLGR